MVSDPVTGQIVEVWVRWRERAHLFDAGPGDRVYTLERITGLVRFGDGRRGLVPPAGAPITVSFRTGGGLSGNAPAASISEPRAAVPFFGGVTNPRPARGGSDAETREITRVRGAERLRHRDRALTPRDFEWLAVEASPSVARARCLAATGPAGAGQRGWVTVVIVPYGTDKQPKPDDELVGRVRRYLAARAPATLAPRIRVISPSTSQSTSSPRSSLAGRRRLARSRSKCGVGWMSFSIRFKAGATAADGRSGRRFLCRRSPRSSREPRTLISPATSACRSMARSMATRSRACRTRSLPRAITRSA